MFDQNVIITIFYLVAILFFIFNLIKKNMVSFTDDLN